MSEDKEWQDENLDSLEGIREEELDEALEPEEFESASGDFKALFDDVNDLDEDDSEEDFLDEEGLSAEAAVALSEEGTDDDDDSLELSETELSELDLTNDQDSSQSEDLEFSAESGESSQSLADAFEKMTEDSQRAAIDLESEEDEESDERMSLSEDTELGVFESAEIEEKEFVDADTVVSVVESVLFSTDRPVGIAYINRAFEGTTVKTDQVKKAIETLQIEYAGSKRGVFLEEVSGGYQLRTKVDNLSYLKRIVKGKPFKLSGPALEVLAIAAYKQPLIKAEVDEIRGVESGHLMRALMDRGLMRFAGKSDLPGKPMLYETTKKFLEIFSLRSLKELPSLSEIDELIPEGIGEEEEKEHLSSVTDSMSVEAAGNYSEGEEELGKIEETLGQIDTTTEFFEQEKAREKARQEKLRADAIREALDFGEEVTSKDSRWLERYDKKMEEQRLALEKEQEEQKLAEEQKPEGEQVNEESITASPSEKAELETSGEGSTDQGNESLDLQSTENLSTISVDKSEVGDESDLLFSDDEGALEELSEAGDESDLLFAEQEAEPADSQEKALGSAFGEIQNALDAFESEDGIDIDAAPEKEIEEVIEPELKPEDSKL